MSLVVTLKCDIVLLLFFKYDHLYFVASVYLINHLQQQASFRFLRVKLNEQSTNTHCPDIT